MLGMKPIKKSYDKRVLIQQANAHIFITLVVSSIIVSASLVIGKILWDQRGYQSRVIAAQETARNQLDTNLTNAEELQNSFVALEASDIDSQLILDALPSKYDFPAVATSVEKIVTGTGGSLASFAGTDASTDAVGTSATPEPVEIPFSVSIEGTYGDVQSFVRSLERSIRPFRIDSMRMSGSDNVMTADLQISTFYQPSTNLDISKGVIQ